MLVFCMYKTFPSLATVPAKNVIKSGIQFAIVLNNKNVNKIQYKNFQKIPLISNEKCIFKQKICQKSLLITP